MTPTQPHTLSPAGGPGNLKFGALAPEIKEQVRSADADRLLGWSERILTAEHLQDIFRD
jgi:hypothetical protein